MEDKPLQPNPSALPSSSNRSKWLLTAKMLPSICQWRSLQLGLPTPLTALYQLFLSVEIDYVSLGCQPSSLPWLTPTPLHWTPLRGTDASPTLVPLTQEELLHPWIFLACANQRFKLHSATAGPLGLAWLLAVLRLWWATAWDLVLVGKLWLGRLLETLASGVSSKSHN